MTTAENYATMTHEERQAFRSRYIQSCQEVARRRHLASVDSTCRGSSQDVVHHVACAARRAMEHFDLTVPGRGFAALKEPEELIR